MTTSTKLSCHEVSRILSDGLDSSLPDEQRNNLRLHLVICEACRNVEQQLSLMREALRMLGVEPGSKPDDDPAR